MIKSSAFTSPALEVSIQYIIYKMNAIMKNLFVLAASCKCLSKIILDFIKPFHNRAVTFTSKLITRHKEKLWVGNVGPGGLVSCTV